MIDHLRRKLRHKREKSPLLALEQIQVKMVVIDQGQEHLLVNPFLHPHNCIKRSDITGKGIKVRPIGAWGMMQ